MKEKGDQCILVGYSTQSKGYCVYNKRTRMIVESIHIHFDEIKEVSKMFVANNTLGLVPQRQKASDYGNPDPVPQRQYASSSANEHVPSQQELVLLFDPLYDEFFNAVLSVHRHKKKLSLPQATLEEMANSAWIEAMQEELHQFDRLQVWELVDKPFGKSIIKLKWLWKNKKDEDQTVIRNKARLVAKGKGLPSKESSLGIEANSKGMIHQSPRGIFINHAKYTLEILYKHGMDKGQSIGTPMAMKPKLDADLSGNPVDQTYYRGKIGSLMYLTSSRPDIVQADSSFELTAFSDVDHAGCIDTRKSTFRGIQFLGDKTEYQLADMFTKALPEDRFKYLVRRIGMKCLTLAELEVLAKESA
nr:hypothetical protein [Tanacetum cinerariifolium]